MFTTDVLIVGAGPAGLATALSALRHGARVLVVERRAGPSTVPRATGISIHTMEVLRGWGVAGAAQAGSVVCEPTVTITDRLPDPPHEVVPLPWPPVREILAASPALPAVIPQDHLEPVLVDEVRRLGGTVRFGAALTALRTSADGVRAVVGGVEVRARFVVGADGSRSTVRTALGIGVERLGVIGEFTLTLFRAAGMPSRPSALIFVKHPDAEGVLAPLGSGRWGYVRAGREPSHAALALAIGRTPEVLGTSGFTMAAAVASAYRAGPGFLVGDAAHRMTPYAGAGLNTAVHDGHELGWRLAWAARGIAGDGLLASYAVEREPVGRSTALRSLTTERQPDDGLPRDLGGTYRSPVILGDGAPPASGHHRTARPGERAPHAWFRADGRRSSTLDLFEGRMTVLAGPEGRWVSAGLGSHEVDGVPVAVLRVGRDLPDPRGAIRRAYRLGAESAVLVRPDGVVAWRHDGAAEPAALVAAIRTAVGRPVPAAVAV
ncbi:MAG TPA: FAD-dependent oxidoreductase [Pseudonocardia sp.]|nr:FAD-dependent oxidoreductase [Pseudonocardia sp.]